MFHRYTTLLTLIRFKSRSRERKGKEEERNNEKERERENEREREREQVKRWGNLFEKKSVSQLANRTE